MAQKVSVLLPAYNAEKTIETAIESIINQTFSDWELIIIDDGSTDQTWNIANKYTQKDSRVKLFKNDNNLKLIATLNKGISLCNGTYIARMDADDWSFPNRLEKQVDFMDSHPEVGVLGATMYVCDEQLNPKTVRKYPLKDSDIRKQIFKFNPFSHPVTIFRKSILEQVKGYSNELKHVEDYDLYFRIGLISQFANLDEPLLKYRTSGSSITLSTAKIMEINTFKTRLKYLNKYQISLVDLIYNFVEAFTLLLIPSNLRVKLFQLIRDVKYDQN